MVDAKVFLDSYREMNAARQEAREDRSSSQAERSASYLAFKAMQDAFIGAAEALAVRLMDETKR